MIIHRSLAKTSSVIATCHMNGVLHICIYFGYGYRDVYNAVLNCLTNVHEVVADGLGELLFSSLG